MEITSVDQNGISRVINPTFEIDGKPLPVFLDQSVIRFLEQNQLDANKLNDLDLMIALPQEIWEITEQPPIDRPETESIASVTFSKMGYLSREDKICTLFLW